MRLNQGAAILAAAVALSTGTVLAQTPNPTFSIGAVAVNDERIQGAPVTTLSVSPGDTITAELYVRDWSPVGDDLRAYQIQLDEASFTSGEAGTIKPVSYDRSLEKREDNPAGAYIDLNHELFVHAGLQTIALTDTKNARGYRWLSVLVDVAAAPVSPEDGTKFYCGTVVLAVASDAKGSFSIELVKDPQVTGLLKDNNRAIGPIDYEGLSVTVTPGAVRYRIVETNPPDGAVDVRVLEVAGRGAAGWQTLTLTFDTAVPSIGPDQFRVLDGDAKAPSIASVSSDGPVVTVSLDRPIRSGRWTQLTYLPTGYTIKVGALPGDVDGDGTCDSRDVLALLNALNAGTGDAARGTDLNGDGVLNAQDGTCLIDLLVSHLTRRMSRS